MIPAEAEAALTEWKLRSEQVDRERDQLVRAAYRAGVNIRQIHLQSGVARSTIYRILGLIAPALDQGQTQTSRRSNRRSA
jgi:hypothetical protein